MKKRFLPFSLLLVIMFLGQSVMADQVGHYVPRAKETPNAEAYISSLRVNQHTGMIDPAWMIAATKQAENSTRDDADVIYWKSMGPDNMGGRTTSIVYNKDNRNQVYVGSMGGGVFYTWNKGISWHQVGENLMVSCMTQDEEGTIYVGTGDCGDAYNYNGLGNLNYTNSFIGSGIYTIKDNEMTLMEGTAPTNINDPEGEWCFINDLVFDNNMLIAATSDGLRYRKDGEWFYAKHEGEDLVGNAIEVKVGSDHTVVASIEGMIYIGSLDNMVCKSASSDIVNDDNEDIIDTIATAAGLLDIAIAPSDPNVIYAANVNASGNHVKIYLSEDQGNSWSIILPTVGNNFGHQVYEGKGLYNHGLVVDPTDANLLYVLGYNIWALQRPSSGTGYYMAQQLSGASTLHPGINAMVFDPRTEENLAYVATDGGIYKANRMGVPYFSFTNCNRGYISTRCLAVAPTNSNTRVLGGVLSHGPIVIEGEEGTNNMSTGDVLLPALTGGLYGTFDESYNAGPCVASLIQPKAFILTTLDGGFQRTEDGGINYDFANFTANQAFSFTGYRMPIAYWESFNDENGADEVWFKCEKNQIAGDVVQCFSNNGGYPFDYTLPVDMQYNEEDPAHSDSLLVPDPITTKLVAPNKNGTSHEIYYTLDAIQFSKAVDWYKLTTFSGTPTCMTFSADGDNLFIGTLAGGMIRISNLREAVDAYTAHPDSADFAPVVTEITLPTTDQCVTSIAVYTDDANKVVVTLGNYGNESYVLYSDDALAEAPTFVAKQGDLPKMPVYSSIYTSTYNSANEGHVIIGTDHGIYRTTNIAASSPVWTLESDNMGDVPVMELKQQLIHQEPQYVYTTIDSVTTVETYPGTNNQGVIYAATYGRGLFRCETYRQNSGASVPENPAVLAESKVSMYPNPVRDAARVSFELNSDSEVAYQVYDMSGRLVKVETLGSYSSGKHEVNVAMNELAKGAYVLRLNAGSQSSTVKFMVF